MPAILLLITDLEIGGTPTVVRELALRLKRQSVDIEVACLGGRGPVAGQITAAGVPVHVLNACCAADVRAIIRLRRLIRRQQYHTILSFLVHANVAAVLATFGVHGIRLIQSIQTTQAKPRWHWLAQNLAARWAQRIVAPSPSVAEMAKTHAHILPEKISIIPNAVDVEAFRFSPSPGTPLSPTPGTPFSPSPGISGAGWGGGSPAMPNAECRMPNHPHPSPLPGYRARGKEPGTRIGFIGRLDPIKRIGDLIDAMTFLPDPFTLHIFGDGPERALLSARISRSGLSHRITLHGQVNSPQEALSRLDFLVLPSDAEGFGLVLIEAMATGVAVIATNAPGIRDVVRHNQTGLLVPCRSPAALAQAISTLTADHALRRRLIESAFKDVQERFTWEPVLQQYRQLLNLPQA